MDYQPGRIFDGGGVTPVRMKISGLQRGRIKMALMIAGIAVFFVFVLAVGVIATFIAQRGGLL